MPDTVAPSQATAAPGQLYDAPGTGPSNKVVAGTLGTALGGVGLGAPGLMVLYNWVRAPNWPEMSIEVAAAIVAVPTVLATIVAGLAGYLKRDRKPT